MSKSVRDRFDDVAHASGRVGAHRAEAPGMNGWVVLLWSFVAALVLIVVGIFVALVLMGRINLFPAAEPTIAPTPEVTGVVDPTYSVLVLNASGQDDLDAQMRDTIVNAGWAADMVSNAPAGSQDFADTAVYYVSEADELAAIGLADVIGGAKVVQDDFYADPNDPEQKQLVVVIGTDRSTVAPESEETPAG
ncbi:LytR C-terminal domain-containing protein [Microbacterium profundi]|uniref:LytR C-terminal domain-containing protein n=1 Tax=Microbacterium profundi TaxID=450380 RepID=A0ABV3LKU5_9MICO|nr:LytR C-terminal domain-containing protein [Microbacterium profundi]MCE7481756.1 LytR C-terminal domain-containing protein [Microbacterium profundi]